MNWSKLFLVLAEICAIILVVLCFIFATNHVFELTHAVIGSLFCIVAVWLNGVHNDMGWRK